MRRKGDEHDLRHATRAYDAAKEADNRKEEARWANVTGNILKNRGQYVEAIEWLRRDYEVSDKYLRDKDILPTCNTLGELHLRLEEFEEALIYQKKHLDLAKKANDLAEQQRASTQLGRTYRELFARSEDDHLAIRNAKKYFNYAMELAKNLKQNTYFSEYSFLTEYIDAHNNLGMLKIDLDDLEGAKKILTDALNICDEEEVGENDDSRSRLHHNLGIVYMEFRNWRKAEEHIRKDISICERIGHCQGEAKGLINFGEFHYRIQQYEKAINCYRKALKLAKSMEDEDALVNQIAQNLGIVEAAIKVIDELKSGEQNLKMLGRKLENATGTANERHYLLQQIASVDNLLEKSSMISAWEEHLKYAKMKKVIAKKLYDHEKLGDSSLVIGESYQKRREFKKALKWYTKSWDIYKRISNLEGQALSKIEMGNVLDSDGKCEEALEAFEDGYRIACDANLPSIQLSALENMHYSYMIRFDNFEKSRNLKSSIDQLKSLTRMELEVEDIVGNCSETETENDGESLNRSEVSSSPEIRFLNSIRSESHSCPEELNENAPLISFINLGKKTAKLRLAHQTAANVSVKLPESSSPQSASMCSSLAVGHKRTRLVLSDDEEDDENHSCRRTDPSCREETATSSGFRNINTPRSPREFQDVSPVASNCAVSTFTPVNLEGSNCSHRSRASAVADQDATDLICLRTKEFDSRDNGANAFENHFHEYKMNSSPCSDENCQHIKVQIDENLVHIVSDSSMVGDKLSIEQLKVEVACLYYLQLSSKKRETGLVPVVEDIKFDGRTLETLEAADILKNHKLGNGKLEASVGVWVPKRVMKLYIDCCKGQPNFKVLKKLYNLEVSEDEVIVSDCELQDISVEPLLNVLHELETVAVIDLSHNLLGNGTMEGLKKLFKASGQNYGALVLDLHSNRLSPSALLKISECPVLYSRLEVLNVSGNRLTDLCAAYLSTILKKCQVLHTLNMENCSITSRTIQQIADSLDSTAALTHLSLGYNHPISSNAIINLLLKITTLERFQELNLTGIKLSKPVVDGLCQLAKDLCLSGLILGSSSIGTDGALHLTSSLSNETQELKLDLSSCSLTPDYIVRLNVEVSLMSGIFELNIGGNPFGQEGGNAMASLLASPQCCLKVLVLRKCQLGPVGILQILEAVSQNYHLEELNLAENILPDETYTSFLIPVKESSDSKQTNLNFPDSSPTKLASKEVVASPLDVCTRDAEYCQLEVADSDDDAAGEKVTAPASSETQFSLPQKSKQTFIQKLLAAVKMAAQLQMLDLSSNGFDGDVAEKLCTAWSSSSRAGLADSHISDNVIHLSMQGKKCWGLRPCCRKF